MAQPCKLNGPIIPGFMPELNAGLVMAKPPVMTAHSTSSLSMSPENQDRHYRALALLFIAAVTGAKSGKAIDASRIRHYVSQPSPLHTLAADSCWCPDAGSDASFNAWAAGIREKNASVLGKGPAAYADALMRTIFPVASPALPSIPAAIYRTWMAIDRMALEQAMDAGVDFAALDKFCSRVHRQFLFNAFLLPRLCVKPSDFPKPRPSQASLREMLADAFSSRSKVTLELLTKYTETQLSETQKARFTRLHKEGKVRELLGENESEIDELGKLKQDFISDAIDLLDEELDHPGYALECLLEIYFSYPSQVHQDLRSSEAAAAKGGDTQLDEKRHAFNTQHSQWRADLAYLTRHREQIDALGAHGKEYFLNKLHTLSRAAYRPRLRPLRLEQILAAARKLPEVIAEEGEPAQ